MCVKYQLFPTTGTFSKSTDKIPGRKTNTEVQKLIVVLKS